MARALSSVCALGVLGLVACGRLGYRELPATAAGSGAGAAVSCRPTPAADYCSALPRLPAPQVLDGVLDCGPTLVDLPAHGWTSLSPIPSSHSARYAVAWRPDGLYFYVEVDDALRLPALASAKSPWCGDGIELYADADGKFASPPAYDDPGTIQLLAAAPAGDSNRKLAVDAVFHTRSEVRVGDWSARHVMVVRDAGYALEAFVTAADLALSNWQLSAGDSVGIDLAIDVSVESESESGDCGQRLGQYFLHVARLPCLVETCRPYLNVDAFCLPRLE